MKEIIVKIENMTAKVLRILALIGNGDRRELSLYQQARGIAAIYHDAGYPRTTHKLLRQLEHISI